MRLKFHLPGIHINIGALLAVIGTLALSGALTPLVPRQYQPIAAALPVVVASVAPAVVKKLSDAAAQPTDTVNQMLQGIIVNQLTDAANKAAGAQGTVPSTVVNIGAPASPVARVPTDPPDQS